MAKDEYEIKEVHIKAMRALYKKHGKRAVYVYGSTISYPTGEKVAMMQEATK